MHAVVMCCMASVLAGSTDQCTLDSDGTCSDESGQSLLARKGVMTRQADPEGLSLGELEAEHSEVMRDNDELKVTLQTVSDIFAGGKKAKINYLHTSGAPAVFAATASNPRGACIPGLRLYTRNTGNQVDAASMVTIYNHPLVDVLELQESTFRVWSCSDKDEGGNPFNGKQVWEYPRSHNVASWNIHNQGIYQNRILTHDATSSASHLTDTTLLFTKFTRCLTTAQYNEENDVRTFRDRASYIDCVFTPGHYLEDWDKTNQLWDFAHYWDSIPTQGWSVGALITVQDTRGDTDLVALMKKWSWTSGQKTVSCVVVFQGSNGLEDTSNFMTPHSSDFCGYQVHTGVKNELMKIVESGAYQYHFKDSMDDCTEVTCAGHSLGGSLCDLYTVCINNPEERGCDYRKLDWNRKWWDYVKACPRKS